MSSESPRVFWSYVHKDNSAEVRRIIDLANDLRKQYELVSGGELELFVDEDSIRWGEDWKRRVDRAVAGAGFFVPIITPRYFQSAECRRELIYFQQEAENERLLPIYYANVPELEDPDPDQLTDEAMLLISRIQRKDWRSLGLEDPSSPAYRQGVRKMAEYLDTVVRELAAVSSASISKLLADAKVEMSQWRNMIDDATPILTEMAELADKATADTKASDARGAGAPGRLRVAARLVQEMRPHTERIASLGQDTASVLRRIDTLVRNVIGETNADHERRTSEDTAELLEEIRHLAAASRKARAQLADISAQVNAVAKYARVLRPALRDVQRGLQGLSDVQAIYDDWDRGLKD